MKMEVGNGLATYVRLEDVAIVCVCVVFYTV